VIGAPGEPEGDVAAEDAAQAHSRQAGEAEAPPGARLAGNQRRAVQADGEAVGQGVDHADPHLLFVLFRPVDRAGGNGGRRGCQPSGHLSPRCRARARRQQI
jgi:hypothetical protein